MLYAAFNSMGKSSTFFGPEAIKDESEVSLLIHRIESHYTCGGKRTSQPLNLAAGLDDLAH